MKLTSMGLRPGLLLIKYVVNVPQQFWKAFSKLSNSGGWISALETDHPQVLRPLLAVDPFDVPPCNLISGFQELNGIDHPFSLGESSRCYSLSPISDPLCLLD
jgi:hypothetical protein